MVWGSLLGGAFSGLGSFLGAKDTNRTSRSLNEQNIQSQNAINDLNYQRQVAFFNLVNDYNSPKNVMQRYKEAGINPNLVAKSIGGGYAESPTFRAEAGIARNYSDSSNPYAHFFNTLGNILTMHYAQQIENTKMEREKLRLDNDAKRIELMEKRLPVVKTIVPESNTPIRDSWKTFFRGLADPQLYADYGKAAVMWMLKPWRGWPSVSRTKYVTQKPGQSPVVRTVSRTKLY